MCGHVHDGQDAADADDVTSILFIGGTLAAVTYAAAADSGLTNASSHSISIDIGAEPSAEEGTRLVVVAVELVASSATNPAVTAATIGGITAQIGTVPGTITGSPGRFTTVFIWAEVPTGTSATVALTLSSSALLRMRSFRAVGLLSFTPTHENGNGIDASGSPVVSTTLNVVYGGVAIAVCHGARGGSLGFWSISGVTQDFTDNNVGGATTFVVGGSLEVTADETGRSISATLGSSGANVATAALAAISFR